MLRHIKCVRCGREGSPGGRGLCTACRWWVSHHGDLSEYPRSTRSNDEIVADYLLLRWTYKDETRPYKGKGMIGGGPMHEIAARMGVSHNALRQALNRARKKGMVIPDGNAGR